MDEWLTVAEVARRLRVDPTTVHRWIKHGSLPAVILPGHGSRHSYRIHSSLPCTPSNIQPTSPLLTPPILNSSPPLRS